jgi:protein-S-isoprenylcysteine O-methyltransferase Ste14
MAPLASVVPTSRLVCESVETKEAHCAPPQLQRVNRHRALRIAFGIPLCFGLFLFLPAGTIIWPKGWIFVLASLVEMAARIGILWRVNPAVVIARSHYHVETQRWDKFLLCFYLPAALGILVVAGFDDGRFHWSSVTWPVCALGYLALLFGSVLVVLAEAANKFFETTVRIQSDRNQQTVEGGPYAIVRHPGYAGFIFIFFGTALALGSLWAVIPALFTALLLLLRTKWEDEMLHEGLVGYQAYAQRIRYRLIVGLW